MKKNINTKYVFTIVIMFLVPLIGTTSCKKNTDDHTETQYRSNEARLPNVEEVSGKALVTWIDPYIQDVSGIVVKDLQTGEEKSIASGAQKAEFEIVDNSLLSYSYEIKVVLAGGQISDGVVARMFKNWAQKIHPRIDYNSNLAPQSGMFFKNNPVQTVKVFDLRQDESLARISAAAMQGVINQQYAYTYLVTQQHHLEQLVDAGSSYELQTPDAASKNSGFATLYNQYKDQFNSLVVFNENQQWSWSMALMIAAQQKCIPVTESIKNFIVDELGLGSLQIMDIRNNWATKEAAYTWALENLADNCHDKMIFSVGLRGDYRNAPWTMYDYTTASKGFCFWLDETNPADRAIMERIFDKMQYPVGTSVFGFGMNEIGDDLNKITNTNNAGFVVSDYYANGSYWCSFPSKSFQQRKGIASEVQPDKIYVAISLSDGDNVQFGQNSLYRIFKEGAHRGSVPLGVTLAAGLQELDPKLLEFYYKNATENEEMTAGPSGFQFIYGDQYVLSGKYDEWLNMNKNWLATAGFHTAHLWQTADHNNFKRYMDQSGVDLVLDGDDRTFTTSTMSYKLSGNGVRMNQGTHCWTEGDVYRDLMSVSPSPRRPVFRHLYLITQYYGYENDKVVLYERLLRELKKAEQDSPNTFEFMLPMDLAASLKKYIEDGGIY